MIYLCEVVAQGVQSFGSTLCTQTTSVDIPMTEAMNHNRMYVPSSINGVEQSVEKQYIQGMIVGIEMMEDENHVKPSVVQISKRQEKKRKVQDGHKTTLYAKW